MAERMGGAEYRALKQIPEVREYRDALAECLRIARGYDGSETQFRAFTAALEYFEEVLQTSPSVLENSLGAKEIEAALRFHPFHPRDINEVLDIAIKSRDQHLRNAFEKKEGSYFIRNIDQVVLPPGDVPENIGDGDGELAPIEFESRLSPFLSFLESKGIFSDDVVITSGLVPRDAFRRKVSYIHVQIPRLHRVVFLCDQVNEATFVIRGYIDPKTSLKKDELQRQFLADCKRIVKHSDAQWRDDLFSYLFTEESWGKLQGEFLERGNKIDIREREEWRRAIQQEIPLDRFLASSSSELKLKKVRGAGLARLFSLFGFVGKIGVRRDQLEFAQCVWGLGYPELDSRVEAYRRTPAEWMACIRARYTPEAWGAMTADQGRSFDIDGWSYGSIMSAAQLPFSDQWNIRDHLLAAKIIWNNPEFKDSREYAPVGWKTISALAQDLRRSFNAVKKRVDSFRVSHPDQFGFYYHPNSLQLCEFISPKISSLVQTAFEGVSSRVEILGGDYAGDKSFPLATPGWQTVHGAFLAYQLSLPPDSRCIADSAFGRVAARVMEEMPDEVEISQDKETARLRKRLSPKAIREVLLRIERLPKTAPEGWFTGPMLLRRHTRNARLISRVFTDLCVERPHVTSPFVDTMGRVGDYFPPDFVQEFELRLHKQKLI